MLIQFQEGKGIYLDIFVQDFQVTPGIPGILHDEEGNVFHLSLDSFRNGLRGIRISKGIWDQVEYSFHGFS
jgi:hypothetical protein